LACPECGRISTVDAVRGETHALFDQPVRLYREALRFWSKHPPGWFWSLDRDGDVRRSRILLAINVMLVFAIVTGGWLVACSCVVTVTGTERSPRPRRYRAAAADPRNHPPVRRSGHDTAESQLLSGARPRPDRTHL
jgi:hypothetical protein